MTVRTTKRLIMLLVALLILLTAVRLGLVLWKGTSFNLSGVVLPLFVVVMLASTWRRLSALEAEHGPDYVQPAPPQARKLLIGVAVLLAVLAGVLGYFLATRR